MPPEGSRSGRRRQRKGVRFGIVFCADCRQWWALRSVAEAPPGSCGTTCKPLTFKKLLSRAVVSAMSTAARQFIGEGLLAATLSGKLLEMAGWQSGDQSLVLTGHETLRALRGATGETVRLLIESGGKALVLEQLRRSEKNCVPIVFGTGRAGESYSLACAAGLDGERAWMESGSHESPTRERGNPSCGPNKTPAILKATATTARNTAACVPCG